MANQHIDDWNVRHAHMVEKLLTDGVFEEGLEGMAAAYAAASCLIDWEFTDDGTGYLTREVKQGDVHRVIELLQAWTVTL